ncbi:hypothetical protein, partial [Dapis sp. BLCC M172]|uniref:hypothetical protein n=1 Tax=Dapis sp. BLCC M172 TaxID=2975281 RepID=UPI003CF0E352
MGRLVSEGKSDTFIIENVLQCKGRKYQEGKAKLAEIKEMVAQLQEANNSSLVICGEDWQVPGWKNLG